MCNYIATKELNLLARPSDLDTTTLIWLATLYKSLDMLQLLGSCDFGIIE